MGAPFQQLAFEAVPELPVVPHRWHEAKRRDVEISTEALGKCRISLREYGAGPPLLLVHGLMTAGYSFRYVLELLGATRTLLIPDLPGAGYSDMPDVKLGADVLARSIVALIDALGIRGAPAIGNSMGGYLCMRAAQLDPAAMSRLVNLHSPGLPTARMVALKWLTRVLPGRWIVDRLVRRDPERWVHRSVHYYDESLKSREEHREFAAPLRTREGRNAFYSHLHDALDVDDMRAFRARLSAETFPIPLCLVYAERDPIVPAVVGDRLRALVPAAQFIRLDKASHFAHVDAAERFVTAIAPFLAGG